MNCSRNRPMLVGLHTSGSGWVWRVCRFGWHPLPMPTEGDTFKIKCNQLHPKVKITPLQKGCKSNAANDIRGHPCSLKLLRFETPEIQMSYGLKKKHFLSHTGQKTNWISSLLLFLCTPISQLQRKTNLYQDISTKFMCP